MEDHLVDGKGKEAEVAADDDDGGDDEGENEVVVDPEPAVVRGAVAAEEVPVHGTHGPQLPAQQGEHVRREGVGDDERQAVHDEGDKDDDQGEEVADREVPENRTDGRGVEHPD